MSPGTTLDGHVLAISGSTLAPLGWAVVGALGGTGFWFLARARPPFAVPCRFMAAVAATWVALSLVYGMPTQSADAR